MIAPLLIIQRVANRSALTSDTIVTGHIISFHDMSQGESTSNHLALPRAPSVNSADNSAKNAGEIGDHGVEIKLNFHRGNEA